MKLVISSIKDVEIGTIEKAMAEGKVKVSFHQDCVLDTIVEDVTGQFQKSDPDFSSALSFFVITIPEEVIAAGLEESLERLVETMLDNPDLAHARANAGLLASLAALPAVNQALLDVDTLEN